MLSLHSFEHNRKKKTKRNKDYDKGELYGIGGLADGVGQ